ncbi:PEPTIDASE S8 [Salix koriyanagi]|uniref:PEPTIDASE S8 n=1 Tax=Salix koriyanagi TaxID=2511006 RepID=A0A9Q0UD06_9ROSI|nr:PEPTIDASE S8 [Salix koriyanagi]
MLVNLNYGLAQLSRTPPLFDLVSASRWFARYLCSSVPLSVRRIHGSFICLGTAVWGEFQAGKVQGKKKVIEKKAKKFTFYLPWAYITNVRTELGTKPAPSMASISSRGPNILEGSILKPDITAPGVRVIAAFTLATGPTGEDYDKRRTAFNTESAIMTTATTRDNNEGSNIGFSQHQGNSICIRRGYTAKDLKLFTDKPYNCPESFSLTDFNYPSISVVNLNDTITVTRRVKKC